MRACMHAVDYFKGCYLGQELTARTHFTGTLRKRIVPVQLEAPSPEQTALYVGEPLSISISSPFGLGWLKRGSWSYGPPEDNALAPFYRM